MRPSDQHDDSEAADPTPDSEYQTTRKRVVMRAVVKLARQVAARRYKVIRGAINWAAYDFTQPGIAVFADEATFLRNDGDNRAVITLEFMTRLPDNVNEIDDDLMDDLHDHAAWVFSELEDMRDPNDASVPIISRLDKTTDSAQEVSDSAYKTQGLIATAAVEF